MSAQPFETRLARLEGTYEQVDKRLDTIHADVRDLRTTMDLRFDSLDRKIDGNLRTMISWMIAQTAVIVGALAAVAYALHK